MSPSTDNVPVEQLQQFRDEQLVKGHFASASGTQEKIEKRIDQ